MVGVDGYGDDGSRRRLPSRMLGLAHQPQNQKACKATSTQVTHNENVVTKKSRLGRKCKDKSINNNENDDVEEELTHSNVVVPKKNRIGRKRKDKSINNNDNGDVEEELTHSNVVVPKKNRIGRKRKDKSVDSDENDVEEELTHNNVVTKKNRLGQKCEDETVNNDENDDADGEELLTVEDLLSIAKEYVEADAVTDEQQSLNTRKQAKSLEKDSNSVELSPVYPTTLSSTTGDPAQDMLNLFLGPLLNKPLEQEKKKPEFTEYDIDFSNKFRKLSQSDAGEEVAAPMKTKSSLKDKVAMLLD